MTILKITLKKYYRPSVEVYELMMNGEFAKIKYIFQRISKRYDPFYEELYALPYLKLKKGGVNTAKYLTIISIDIGLIPDAFME